MASGPGADLGLGTGLGGAPAAYDATRLDVWPPCGHKQRLAKGGAMGYPPADADIATGAAIGGGAGRALVAGSCCRPRTIAWTSCNILSEASSRRSILRQALLRYTSSTRGCARYRTNGLLGGPARRQGAARRGPLPIVQRKRG